MMHRWSSKLRSLNVLSAQARPSFSSSRRLLHSPPPLLRPLHFASNGLSIRPLFDACSSTYSSVSAYQSFRSSLFPSRAIQVRHVSSRERRKRRKPMTPVTSKLKKVKMKAYSSYKSRFRTMKDGTIRRWKEGKLHNAHLKSKKSKRRLRQPGIVPVAFAKVMKKLNFCG